MPSFPQFFKFKQIPHAVCRLGLATRGNTRLQKEDAQLVLEQGINYWNWCGHEDGMSQAIRELSFRRTEAVIAIQLSARDEEGAQRELDQSLTHLRTNYLDVVTFYYVESSIEWNEISKRGGALNALKRAQEEGSVRMIGVTTHQRRLASEILRSQTLDLLMVRYNAAHRGAEMEIFPTAEQLKIPIITFTSQRWKALLQPTPEDPKRFVPPPAREWYRFALASPAVSVVLMAPGNRTELLENLKLLSDWRPPSEEQHSQMVLHGERVRRHAGRFP